MSINVRLFAGSLLIAAIALGFFVQSQAGQFGVRSLSWQVFARGVEPLAAVQAAHTRASTLEARYLATAAQTGRLDAPQADELLAELTIMLDRLGEAAAPLPAGSASLRALDELRFSVSRLRATHGEISERLLRRELSDIGIRFDSAVTQLRADVVQMRDRTGASLAGAMETQAIGLVVLLAALGVFAAFLSASVAGPLRAAAGVVRSIEEDVERPVTQKGRGHFAEVFGALSSLQSRLAERKREGERMRAAEVARLQDDVERERRRFEATIDNMSEGYCLLDEKRNLVAANGPFRRMFSHLKPGAKASDLAADPALEPVMEPQAPSVVVRETAEGQVIEVRRHGLSGRGTIITVENVTAQHAASRRIEELAGRDALTGLPNRERLFETLDSALKGANTRQDLAVLCVDIAGFRQINAVYGNSVGDTVLRVAAQRLGTLLGEGDVLARTGADEFAVIQTRAPQPGGCGTLARAIAQAFAEPVPVDGGEIEIGVGIGMVHLKARGQRAPLDPFAVMRDGEMAMERARGTGGLCLFSEEMRRESEALRQLQADLKLAVPQGQLELFYQPFVDVARGKVSGFEALLRWRHPVRGLVAPGEFIAVAEGMGLIDDIGGWVLGEACRQAATWPEGLAVSVNLSPLQFRSPQLVVKVARALGESGLAPARLQLEVTESVFLDEVEGTLETLSALRALGPTISMDDFGTGYSSLGYLSRFPFDKIKIDQSFVRGMAKPENEAIVRAVIGLSSAMGMAVIAEGVETRAQFDLLCREGCREMQGYLFSKPRPVSDLARLILTIDGTFASGELPKVAQTSRRARKASAA
ncbi:putative bifunctional diguanylate cyclase/phosphodiesterase [Aureimonas mangrovi]|uniref:putative bifunctional diguanylate cyclase/phosphodiesterase n=1 Tax=Aureimonas mangrovi TaxID=2758041 RepID=UPI00163D8411|nr:EAL domain-containing protein [Aureimonas mangrovi]